MKEKNLQLYRNLNILSNRDEALLKINEILINDYIKDGTPYVCRYEDNGEMEMLFAIAMKQDNDTKVSIYDTKIIKELESKIDELTQRVEILEKKIK